VSRPSRNTNGIAAVTTDPDITQAGDYVTLVVKAEGYKTARLRYLITEQRATKVLPGAFSRTLINYLFGAKDPVQTFVLERGSDTPEDQVDLTIEVHDEDGDPVPKATVKLCCSNTAPLGTAWTNATGETFWLIPKSDIQAGLQARVTAPDGRSQFSQITSNVVEGTGPKVFLVVLPNAKLTPPSKLTLTVNGTTGTATKTATLAQTHPTAPQVAPNSSLTIKATVDRPLPKGWRLIVFHNGDPKSQGNGNYYTVCQINGANGNTQTSCGDTRPTLPSPGDDFVGAQVQSPQGLLFNIQIYIPVR
jgi:hypothetical protein